MRDSAEAGLGVEVVKVVKLELETARHELLLSNLAGADWWKNRLSVARAWEHFVVVPVSWGVCVVRHAFAVCTPASWHIASLLLGLRKTSANVADDSSLLASGRIAGRPLANGVSWNCSRSAWNVPTLFLVALVDWLVDVLGSRAKWVTGNVHAGTFNWSVIWWHDKFLAAVDHLFSSWNDGERALVFLVALLLSLSAHTNTLVALVGSDLWAWGGLDFSCLLHSREGVDAIEVAVISGADWASESHLRGWAVSSASAPWGPVLQWEIWCLAGLGLNIISLAAAEVFSRSCGLSSTSAC